MKSRDALTAIVISVLLSVPPQTTLRAQQGEVPHAPPRTDEGDGPFQRLIIRGATLVDGTGAPPVGPVDIVVEGSRIVEVRSVGAPNVPIRDERRPRGATRELDAHGMYVLPGFVDVHAHIGGVAQGTPAEYVYKLWLGSGVTTIRDPGAGNGIDWTLQERDRSAKNEIVAPHIYVYAFVGTGWDGGPVRTPEKARAYVRWAADKGVDGFKLIPGSYPVSNDPKVFAALIDEARKLHLGTMSHLSQQGVSRINALDAARMGLGSMEHYYGLPEALFDDRTVQDAELLAEQQGKEPDFGIVEAGKRADLVITEYNPIEDLKVLYGTGTLRLNDENGRVERVGGVRYTIKGGIVYDARRLLDDVARMVSDAKAKAGMPADAPLTVLKGR